MTTEEYKEMYNITVTNFDIMYVTFQGSGSETCSAHALATMLNIYYGANLYNWNDFWNENDSQANLNNDWVKGDNYYSSESEYLSEIKQRLDYGMPVEIVVKNGKNTHFVTAIGYELDENGDFTFDGIVIADPGTSSDKKVTTIGNAYTTYTEYEYGSDGYRIIIPYLIDENNQFILDEDGNKTIDLKYAQVVENVDTGEGIESDEEIIEDLEKYLEEMPVGKAALDKELNVAIGIIYEEGSTRASKFVRIFNGEGKQLAHLNGVNATIDDISNWTIKNIVVNKEKGTWSFDMIHTNSNGSVSKSTPSGYSAYLIGYGSEGHTFSAISL